MLFDPGAADRIVDGETARQAHQEALRTRAMVGWVVMENQPAYPGKLIARLATNIQTVNVLIADTLAELRAALPPGLAHSPRMPGDPPGVVEIWFS